MTRTSNLRLTEAVGPGTEERSGANDVAMAVQILVALAHGRGFGTPPNRLQPGHAKYGAAGINHAPIGGEPSQRPVVGGDHPGLGRQARQRTLFRDPEVEGGKGEARLRDGLELVRRRDVAAAKASRGDDDGTDDDFSRWQLREFEKGGAGRDLQNGQVLGSVQNALGARASQSSDPGERLDQRDGTGRHAASTASAPPTSTDAPRQRVRTRKMRTGLITLSTPTIIASAPL